MKLHYLRLNNFQGVKSAEYVFDSKSANIFGDNATGKTTVYNAFTWLLFDKASTGAKGFTPKTKGADGDLHNLDHEAEAGFILGDGRLISFKKTYKEVYKKVKGAPVAEFSGNKTEYSVDGVPVKEKEYQSTIEQLFGNPEQLKMLTMPTYFAEEMNWDERRKILLDVCGDVTDADVIKSNDELKDLPDHLLMAGSDCQHYTVDAYKKIAGAQKAQINKQLQDIPNRIDEANRAIPDLTDIDPVAIGKQIATLSKEKAKAEADKANVVAGDSNAGAIREQVAIAKAELAEARTAHIEAEAKKCAKSNTILDKYDEEVRTAESELRRIKYDLESRQVKLESMKLDRAHLLNKYVEEQAKTWDESQKVCPTCKQALPVADIEKLIADFKQKKSDTLTEINEKGKACGKDVIAGIEKEIADRATAAKNKQIEIDSIEVMSIDAQKRAISVVPFEDTDDFKKRINVIADAEKSMRDSAADRQGVTAEYDKRIDSIGFEIKDLEEQQAVIKVAEIQRKRITELEAEEKSLASQYELIERGLFLCDMFIKTKVAMLTDRINDKFKSVCFRLFVDQINGGVKEDCEVMIPGANGQMVPFATANNAARINAGLEIIGVLSGYWGLSMPVFIDNAESVTKLAETGGQVIRLIVSEKDKELRMEIEK